MTPTDAPSLRRTLYRIQGAVVLLPGEGQIGPIDWTLERGHRVRVRCAHPAQWEALVALLSGERAPATGAMEEVVPVRVQTDLRVRESLSPNRTLREFLESPDAPESVWLGGRRRSLWVLLDALGISPALARRAYRYLSPEQQAKVWAFRFLLSRASLLIGREVFRIPDPLVQAVIARRWGDLPGTVVVGESDVPLPGPTDQWAALDAEGHFTCGADVAAAPAGETSES
jgi:hypothetical protein